MSKKPFQYELTEIYKNTYIINEFYSTMAILVGETRALVIDCGVGAGDFKALIERVTDKPYDVVMTHSHVDHIGGRGQFSDIYLSEKDAPYIKSVNTFMRKGYKFISKFSLQANFSGVKLSKIKSEPKTHFVKEGDVFDLGNRKITIYETPGHTVGSISLLDESNRTIFIGDVANEFLLMFLPHCTTIETMLDTHNRLLSMDCYDTVYSSHHTSSQTRDELIIYRDGAQDVLNTQKKNKLFPPVKFHDNKGAKLVYRPHYVFNKK